MRSHLLEEFLGRIPQDYLDLLQPFFADEHYLKHLENLGQLESSARLNQPDAIYPAHDLVFRALHLTPVNDVKVVILGQDPYHTPGLAQGLAFSVPEHIPTNSKAYPSSLRNMSKALYLEGFEPLPHGNLVRWANQGVLLLNRYLSVAKGLPNSHQSWGWHLLTDAMIQGLSKQHPIVWLLWGKSAQKSIPRISDIHPHLVLCASHPSGLGVYQTQQPFLHKGDKKSCGHFQETNAWLKKMGKSGIEWSSPFFVS
jgi:uracil-DNA glycosylase